MLPTITLYDAIYTTEENIIRVKENIETETKRLTINPIKVEVKNLETGSKITESDFEYLRILDFEKGRIKQS